MGNAEGTNGKVFDTDTGGSDLRPNGDDRDGVNSVTSETYKDMEANGSPQNRQTMNKTSLWKHRT
jgi:hypothetical protein